MKSGFSVIFMWLFLSVASSSVDENSCLEHCLGSVKPIFDHYQRLTNSADTNKKLLSEKDDLIKGQAKQIEEKGRQIKDLTDLLLRSTCPIEGAPDKDQWIPIQKRYDGSLLFNRTWSEFRNGFGNCRGEFFIGLEKLHNLTRSQQYQLLINLGDVNGSSAWALYDDFRIGNESEAFYLKSLGVYRGTAGDSLTRSIPMKFSTLDRDNDTDPDENCAARLGGWWFYHCAKSSLNGVYYKNGTTPNIDGIFWSSWRSDYYTISLTFTEMKIRSMNHQKNL
ncbi:fibrinogen C domain-containing protein 1 [Drosophila biarmipes]|uniref:fibrinogen C domain-containing protein 1 n=1 Tax=Drosophila biarmipes TaxID=125945 RepID=UPI0007E89F63|nr:fibrinogen C domain-containing protein 1 [Drosophila biarmipes]